jgi:beta-galactosidase
MAHILPHWNWPERIGQITPVHVFSSGDEAELFLNNVSMGRKKKGQYEYRFRWDSVVYKPGELRVVTYKNGQKWATDIVKTVGDAKQLQLTADRSSIKADGNDLSFVTLKMLDDDGLFVAFANNPITFEISGPGEIVATDNGDPADLVAFPSKERKAYNGLALVIIRGKAGVPGRIKVTAKSAELNYAQTIIIAR